MNFRRRIDQIPLTVLLLVDTAAILLQVSTHGLLNCTLVLAAGGLMAGYPEMLKLLARQRRRSSTGVELIQVIFCTVFLVSYWATPAAAQFFQGAESWMTTAFQTNGGTDVSGAVKLFFNILRGLFLLYLGIALVRVINAARNDEDWQNLARTPLIILGAVTMGDFLANMITGGGGGPAT